MLFNGLLLSNAVLDTSYGWVCSINQGLSLEYWFSPSGFGLAPKTVERMLEKVSRLYEQGADEQRIETDLKHYWRWVRSGGMDGIRIDDVLVSCFILPYASLSSCWLHSPLMGLIYLMYSIAV